MLGLTEIKTAIQFVSDGTGGGGGGTSPIAQTSDVVFILTTIIALAVIAIGCGIYAFSKSRKLANAEAGATGALSSHIKKASIAQKAAIVIAVLAAVCSIGIGVAKAPVLKAFAEAEEEPATTTVFVDENTGAITKIEGAVIKNTTNGDFFLTSANIEVTKDAETIAGAKDVTFKIESNNDVVFEGKPSKDFIPSENLLFWWNESATTKYSLGNISAETAKALIGKSPYILTLSPYNTTIITYDANGATSGQAPAPFRLDWNTVIQPEFDLAKNTGGLEKSNKYLDGWNTKPDGSGTDYTLGQKIYVGDPLHTSTTLYAKWTNNPSNVAVTFYTMDGVFDDATGGHVRSIAQNFGKQYIFPPDPVYDITTEKDNWEFTGWYTMPYEGQEGCVRVWPGDPVQNPDPHSLFAHWKPKTAEIHFYGNGGTPQDQKFEWNYGQKYDLTQVEQPQGAATFLGWYTDPDPDEGEEITGDEIVNDDSPREIYAHWYSAKLVKVYFDANNESGDVPQEIDQTVGLKYSFDLVDEPEYKIDGWDNAEFIGWYTQPEGGNEVTEDTTVVNDQPHTLYAHWKMPTVMKKFYANGGIYQHTNEDYVEVEQTYNSVYKLPTSDKLPQRYGHDLEGWYTSQTGGQKIDGTICRDANPIDISAHWTVKTFTVTFNAGAGHFSSGKTITLEQTYGQPYNMPEEDPVSDVEGMEFEDAWYSADNNGGYKINPSKVEDCDTKTIFAGYIGIEVPVKLMVDGVEYKTTTERYLQTFKLQGVQDPEKDNYDFAGWYYNNTKINVDPENGSVVPVYTEIALQAKWNPKIITMTFEGAPGKYGIKTTTTVTQTYNANYVLPSNPLNTGYNLDGWFYKDAEQVEHQLTSEMTVEDLSLDYVYAKWTPMTFPVEFYSNGSLVGTVNQTFDTEYDFPEVSRDGYNLKCWNTSSDGQGIDISSGAKVTDSEIRKLYAKWEAKIVVAEFDANEGSWTGGITKVEVAETFDSNYKLPEAGNPSRDGYNFKGWFTDPDDPNTKIDTTKKVVNPENHKIFAVWEAKTIQVTFIHNDYMTGIATSTVHAINQTFNELYVLDIPLTANYPGYNFVGWYLNSSLSEDSKIDPDNTKVTNPQPHNVYGKWSPKTPTITFNGNGGTWGTQTTIDKVQTYGQTFVFPDSLPQRSGYNVEAWYLNDECTGTAYYSNDICRFYENTTLYAKWKPKTLNVTFDSDGGNPAHQYIIQTFGSKYIIPTAQEAIPKKTGYTFAGWFTEAGTEGTHVDADTYVTTSEDHTLYAHWTSNKYALTLNNSSNDPLTTIYELYGQGFYSDEECENEITATMPSGIPLPEKDGYSFKGYYTTSNKQIITEDGKLNIVIEPTEFSSSATLVAKWEAQSGIIVTFDAAANGGNFDDGTGSKTQAQTYDANYVITPEIPEKDGGYKFIGWYTTKDSAEGVKIDSTVQFKQTGPQTLYARYEDRGEATRSVIISYKCGQTYLAETFVDYIVPTVPETKYYPKPITGYTPQEDEFIVYAGEDPVNKTFEYDENQVTISFYVAEDSKDFGIVNPGGQTVGVITGNPSSTATAKPNYEFVNWTLADGTPVSTDAVLQPEKVGGLHVERSYYAHFQPKTCTLTFLSTDPAGGTVDTSTLDVPYGTQCSLNDNIITFTKPNEDIIKVTASRSGVKYSFSNWTVVGSTGRTIEKDTIYLANFKENKVTIEFASNEHGKIYTQKETVLYGSYYQIENGNLRINVGDPDEKVIEVFANDGYQYSAWVDKNGDPIDDREPKMIDAGMEKLTVIFDIRKIKIKYNIHASSEGLGTITTTDTNVDYFTSYEIKDDGTISFSDGQEVKPFEASEGYHFSTWDVDKTGTIETPNADDKESNWYVSFAINTFKMNFETSPEGKGSVLLDPVDAEIPWGTTWTCVKGTLGEYDKIVFGNLANPIQVAIPAETSGYSETAPYWTVNGSSETKTGVIYDDTTIFTANFTKDRDKVITYKMPYDMRTGGRNGIMLKWDEDNSSWVSSEEFYIEVDPEGVIDEHHGAKIREQSAYDTYPYYFMYWTNETTGEVVSESGINDVFIPTKAESEGWSDTTYVCHFGTPVVIWDDVETMTVTYSEDNYIGREWDYVNYVFPVYDNCHIEYSDNPDDSIIPSWLNWDGSPKFNATHINIEPVFKYYRKLQSTSGWFMYADFNPWSWIYGETRWYYDYSRRLTDINGLENIYTEGITDTSYMFATDTYSHAEILNIDLSSWNTPNLTNVEGMFMNCAELRNVEFPDAPVNDESPRFGENVTDMKYMFTNCKRLSSVTLNGNFASPEFVPEPIIWSGKSSAAFMFSECHQLKTVTITSPNFGKYITSATCMFSNDSSLEYFNCPSKVMCSVYGNDYYCMFDGCYLLKSLDITGYKIEWDANVDIDWMFGSCNSLCDLTIGENWKQNPNLTLASAGMPSNWDPPVWYKDHEMDTYRNEQIPNESGPGNYSKKTAKAVYTKDEATNTGQFTFYFDYEIHEGTVFNIPEYTGFQNNNYLKVPDWYEAKSYYNGQELSEEEEGHIIMLNAQDNSLGASSRPIGGNEPEPLDLKYDLKSKFDAPLVNVTIDASFIGYSNLRSLAFWFCADSTGYCPFNNFEGLKYINTTNINRTYCMFGGLDANVNLGWYFLNSGIDPADYNVHSQDTFNNNKIVSKGKDYLDLGEFDCVLDSEGYMRHYVYSYSGMFANCAGLESVKLPKYLGSYNYWPEGWDMNDSMFSHMFENCRSLKTITNIEYMETEQQWCACYMFAGCSSLESLNLKSFNTRYAYDNIYLKGWWYSNWTFMFEGCDRLSSLTIGSNWNMSMDYFGLPETYNVDDLANSNPWKLVQEDEAGNEIFTPRWTSDIPLYDDFDWSQQKPTATYVRDPEKITEKVIKVVSNDSTLGKIVPENFEYKYVDRVSYSVNDYGLRIGTQLVRGEGIGENGLKRWSLDGEVIEQGILTESAQYLETDDLETTFIGHFGEVGNIAKAVYNKQEQTLTFYYDRLSHEGPGLQVFPVENDYGYYTVINSSGGGDHPLRPVVGGITPVDYMIKVPSWYCALPNSANPTPEYIASVPIANPAQAVKLNDYKFYSRIQPKEVIFSESFSKNDELQSISCWFMADSTGLQTVEKFSSIVNGVKKDGFFNLNTMSLKNVNFAFGGIFAREYAEYELRKESQGGGDIPILHMILNLITGGQSNAEKLIDLPIFDMPYKYDTYGSSLRTLDMSEFDFSHLKDASNMFANCLGLQHIKFAPNATQNIQNFYGFFANDEFLGTDSATYPEPIEGLDSFNTTSALYMDYMFFGCSNLKKLNLSSFHTENVSPVIPKYLNGGRVSIDSLPHALGMFHDCTRLEEITISSEFDSDYFYQLKGWGINLNKSGLYDLEDNPWINEDGQPVETAFIPTYDPPRFAGQEINTGKFVRESIPEQSYIVEPAEAGTGLIDGKESYTYNVTVSCQVSVVESDRSFLSFDMHKVKATGINGNNFKYFVFDEGFGDLQGSIVPSNFSQLYDAEPGVTKKIKAVFDTDPRTPKAVYSAALDGKGTPVGHFEFVYDDITYVPGEDDIVAVYDIDPCWSESNLPAWFMKGNSANVDYNLKRPRWRPEVEIYTLEDGTKVQIGWITSHFASSFKNYIQLQSLSCWFMDGFSTLDGYTDRHLWSGFLFDEFSFTGLENIPTANINNVNYMFGGHEYFNDLTGSRSNYICLKGFDSDHKLKTTAGLFANCLELTEVDFGTPDKPGYFDTSGVTDMTRMFYNCRELSTRKDYFSSVVGQVDTSSCTNMTEMFALSNYNANSIERLNIDSRVFVFTDKFDTSKVINATRMFAGIYDAYSIYFIGPITFENVITARGMFQDCWNLQDINTSGASSINLDKNQDTSYMFAGCYNLYNTKNVQDFVNLKNVQYASYMFDGCSNLHYAKLNKPVNDIVIKDARYMFYNCYNLEQVDLSNLLISQDPLVVGDDRAIFDTDMPYYGMLRQNDGGQDRSLENVKLITISESWDITLRDIGLRSEEWYNENERKGQSYQNYEIPYTDIGEHVYGTFGCEGAAAYFDLITNTPCWGNPLTVESQQDYFAFFNSAELKLDENDPSIINISAESGKFEHAVPNCIAATNGQFQGWYIKYKDSSEEVKMETGKTYSSSFEDRYIQEIRADYTGWSPWADFDRMNSILTFDFHEEQPDTSTMQHFEISLDGYYESAADIPWSKVALRVLRVNFTDAFNYGCFTSVQYWFAGFRSLPTFNAKDCLAFKYVDRECDGQWSNAFANCTALGNVELPEVTTIVNYMNGMFDGCGQLIYVNFGGVTLDKVHEESVENMFGHCGSIKLITFNTPWRTSLRESSGLINPQMWIDNNGNNPQSIPNTNIDQFTGTATYSIATHSVDIYANEEFGYIADRDVIYWSEDHPIYYGTKADGSLYFHVDGLEGYEGTDYVSNVDFTATANDPDKYEFYHWTDEDDNKLPENLSLTAISAEWTYFEAQFSDIRDAWIRMGYSEKYDKEINEVRYLTNADYEKWRETEGGNFTRILYNASENFRRTQFNTNYDTVVFDSSMKYCTKFTSTAHMFDSYRNIHNLIGIENLNMINVETAAFMFQETTLPTVVDLSSWDTPKLRSTRSMFSNNYETQEIIFNTETKHSFTTKNLEDASRMFWDCDDLCKVDVSSWVAPKLKNCEQMFYYCQRLDKINMANLNANYVENCSNMFRYCFRIQDINLSGLHTDFDTSEVYMFVECNDLKNLDISNISSYGWDQTENMFSSCYNLQKIIIGDKFNTLLGDIGIPPYTTMIYEDGHMYTAGEVSSATTGPGTYRFMQTINAEVREYRQNNLNYDCGPVFGRVSYPKEEVAFGGPYELYYKTSGSTLWLQVKNGDEVISTQQMKADPYVEDGSFAFNPKFIFWETPDGNPITDNDTYRKFNAENYSSNTFYAVFDADTLKATIDNQGEETYLHLYYGNVSESPYTSAQLQHWSFCNGRKIIKAVGNESNALVSEFAEFYYPWNDSKEYQFTRVDTHESLKNYEYLGALNNFVSYAGSVKSIDLSNLCLKNISSFQFTFQYDPMLQEVKFGKDMETNMPLITDGMFTECQALKKVEFWEKANFSNMDRQKLPIFQNCPNVSYISYGSNVTANGDSFTKWGLPRMLTWWNDITDKVYRTDDITPGTGDMLYGTFIASDRIPINFDFRDLESVGTVTTDLPEEGEIVCVPGLWKAYGIWDPEKPNQIQIKIDPTWGIEEQLYTITFEPDEEGVVVNWYFDGLQLPKPNVKTVIEIPSGIDIILISGHPEIPKMQKGNEALNNNKSYNDANNGSYDDTYADEDNNKESGPLHNLLLAIIKFWSL